MAEPTPRYAPFSAPIGGQVFLSGGRTGDFHKDKSSLLFTVHSFDVYCETWRERVVEGAPPPGIYDGACASSGLCLYCFGGGDGSTLHGSLHQLDTSSATLKWTQLTTPDSSSRPMMKTGCGMVAYGSGLVLFGGYGFPCDSTQPGAEFVKDDRYTDGVGWSNELHVFDVREGTWSSPNVSGQRPPPCAHFSFTKTDDHHVVLFGGRQPQGRTSDLYILDLTKMHWSKLDPHEEEPRPGERSAHTAVCLGAGDEVLVYGGLNISWKVLSDMWVLDVYSGRWREIKVSNLTKKILRGRSFHSATAISHTPTLVEVIVFGGCPEWPKDYKTHANLPPIGNTVVLRFEYQQSASTNDGAQWVLTDVADSSQLATPQKLGAKMEKIIHTLKDTSLAPRGGGMEGRSLEADRRVRVAEDRAREAQTRLQESEAGRLEAQTRLQESEAGQLEAQTRLQESEVERLETRTRLQESERTFTEQLRLAREQAARAERRLRESEGRLRECEEELEQLREIKSQWAVDRAEIHVTEEELGRGSWATVSVATFRGARVAAKVIHNQIISQHNVELVRREMDMAARIRHPNLLQFIGATQEGEMVILTELMPTSLRREVEKEYMLPSQTTAIGLDVARALNYLHQMRPHPLIHRDISSANVLLEPLSNIRWRAKVSDYGTVNLLQQLQTVGPGSPCYAAPEANDPTRQSPKMDIFSFGALLVEMLTGELPAPDHRPRLLRAIRHQRLLALIQRCLSENREARPNASDIITELDS